MPRHANLPDQSGRHAKIDAGGAHLLEQQLELEEAVKVFLDCQGTFPKWLAKWLRRLQWRLHFSVGSAGFDGFCKQLHIA